MLCAKLWGSAIKKKRQQLQEHESPTDSQSTAASSTSSRELLGNSAMQEMMGTESGATPRFSYGAQTICDLDHRYWPQGLQTKFALRADLPAAELGRGVPEVRYFSEFQSLGPGMQRIIRAHEQVHVDNARPYSSAFKAQIDDQASGWIFGVAGEKTISTNDYTAAYNDNFGGLHPSCETDESMAYKRTVEVAEQVLADPAFANEHDLVRLNLPKFEAESDAPSTCD